MQFVFDSDSLPSLQLVATVQSTTTLKDHTAKARWQIEEASDKWEEMVYKYF